MTYLDNAATSWPKPPEVARAMSAFLADVGANPGRSGHRASLEAAGIVADAREAIAGLVGASDPLRVLFGANATEGINLALTLLRPGDRVVTTSMEHNAVMRPLRAAEAEGVQVDVVACAPDGTLDQDAVAAVLPGAALLVATGASNVTGTLLPICELGALAREASVPFLVDAAQTAGCVPLDLKADGIDLLAFTGHKGLYGPMGTGGLVLGDGFDPARLRPLKRGGTGSASASEDQPQFLPDRFEAGTLNVVGLAGLAAGVAWVRRQGIEDLAVRERALTARLRAGLATVPGVRVFGPHAPAATTAVVSFTIDGRDLGDAALALDDAGVACRVGLHCAPSAHRTIGTFPAGTIRFSLGAFTGDADVDAAVEAVAALVP